MPRTRKTHSPALKAKVAVEAIKEQRTVSRSPRPLASTPIWFPVGSARLWSCCRRFLPQSAGPARPETDPEKEELYRQIGHMKVELDFLKKKACLLD